MEDYKSLITDDDFTRLRNEEKAGKTEEWITMREDDKIRFYRKPKAKLSTFKVYMYFKHPADLMYSLACNVKLRLIWDPTYKDVKDVQVINNELDIIYFQLNTPFGVSPRDSLLLRARRRVKRDDGSTTYMVICKTVKHPKYPITKKFVRTTAKFHAYLIEMEKDLCKLFLYSESDFGGYIPKWVIDYVSKRKPNEWYNNLLNLANKMKQLPKKSSQAEEEWPHNSFIRSRL